MSKIIDFAVIAVNYCLCLSKEKKKEMLEEKTWSQFFLMILAVHYRICIIMKIEGCRIKKIIKAIIFKKRADIHL